MAQVSDMNAGHLWSFLVSDHGLDRVEAWAVINDYYAPKSEAPEFQSLSEVAVEAAEIARFSRG